MASTKNGEKIVEAEEALNQIPNGSFTELCSFAKPPLCVVALTEAIGILLNPSKQSWSWDDDKSLMAGGKNAVIERLTKLDKDSINDDQLEKVRSILARDDCQPDRLASVSPVCAALRSWLQAIVTYATEKKSTQ